MTTEREVLELTASEYVFLTLAGGQTLQANDKVIMQRDMAERTLTELAGRVTLTDEFKFEFDPGDVTAGTDRITENTHGMLAGDPVKFETTADDLPAPLQAGKVYYVLDPNANDFQVEESVGGGAVDITDQGTGTHTVRKLNKKLKNATFEIVRA